MIPPAAEQETFYRAVAAARREREHAATEALRAAGADWETVATALEMFWPQSSAPSYLTAWARESLGRLSRNARQRRGLLKVAERKHR